MKKRDILIVVLGVALLVSVIWMMQGDEIKEKVAEERKGGRQKKRLWTRL